jgi:hypothetical protein
MGKAIGNISIHHDVEGVRVALVAGRIRHEATGEHIEAALIALAKECRDGFERARFATEIS